MPFKSRAQRRKFAELLVKGEIKPETFEEWNRETGRKELPERVKRKAKGKRKSAAKRKAATTRKAATKRKSTATKRRPRAKRKAKARSKAK